MSDLSPRNKNHLSEEAEDNPKNHRQMLNLSSNFPSDVTTDILYQLPVKTLVRFRCVSKPWCSQIDGPDFIKLHLSHSLVTKANLSLILKKWYLYMVEFDSLKTATELAPPLNVIWGMTEAFGCCNGLVALCNSDKEIALWNPSTRKSQILPDLPVEAPGGDVKLRRFRFYGFGFDPINDDYKVVRMVQFLGQDGDGYVDEDGVFFAEVKVYSLKTNSWREINDLPYYLRFLFQLGYLLFHRRGFGVLASGALHWVASIGFGLYLIVAFDLGVEKFRNLPLPDNVDNGFEMDVGVLDGKLCMICNYSNAYVDVWVMKEYGVKESWTNLFKVPESCFNRPIGHVVPVAYSKSCDKVLLEVDKEKLVWFDIGRRKVKKVKIEGAPNSYGAALHVESLVPLGGGGMDRRRRQQPQEEKKKSNIKKMDDFLSKGFKLNL